MFSLPADKDDALRIAELTAEALAAISTIVYPATAGTAASVLTVVRMILQALEDGYEGKITVDEVRAELNKILPSLAVSDAEADEALRKKFDKKKPN